MKRRQFVATAGALGVGVVGGTRLLSGGPQIGGDMGAIAGWEFTAFDPGSEEFEAAPGIREPPAVDFDRVRDRVVVTGKFFVGSGSCDRAALKRVFYDERAGTLRVVVESGQKFHLSNGCTMEESADAYRASFVFANGLPDRVTVEETDDPSGHTVTVERSASGGER